MGYAIDRISIFNHCGWTFTVGQDFEAEVIHNGLTLRVYNHKYEVSISSTQVQSRTDAPFSAEDILKKFPPAELTGVVFEHKNKKYKLYGKALWMMAHDEDQGNQWVLMSLMIHQRLQKMATMTVVCPSKKDYKWAVKLWRGLSYIPEMSAPYVQKPM